jgi:hypothetical protein
LLGHGHHAHDAVEIGRETLRHQAPLGRVMVPIGDKP